MTKTAAEIKKEQEEIQRNKAKEAEQEREEAAKKAAEEREAAEKKAKESQAKSQEDLNKDRAKRMDEQAKEKETKREKRDREAQDKLNKPLPTEAIEEVKRLCRCPADQFALERATFSRRLSEVTNDLLERTILLVEPVTPSEKVQGGPMTTQTIASQGIDPVQAKATTELRLALKAHLERQGGVSSGQPGTIRAGKGQPGMSKSMEACCCDVVDAQVNLLSRLLDFYRYEPVAPQ